MTARHVSARKLEELARTHLPYASSYLLALPVSGDAMAPTLLDGDQVVIDCETCGIDADAMYVIELQGRPAIKRVQRRFDGSLSLLSDNPSYENERIPRAQAHELRVLGRVVWPR